MRVCVNMPCPVDMVDVSLLHHLAIYTSRCYVANEEEKTGTDTREVPPTRCGQMAQMAPTRTWYLYDTSTAAVCSRKVGPLKNILPPRCSRTESNPCMFFSRKAITTRSTRRVSHTPRKGGVRRSGGPESWDSGAALLLLCQASAKLRENARADGAMPPSLDIHKC